MFLGGQQNQSGHWDTPPIPPHRLPWALFWAVAGCGEASQVQVQVPGWCPGLGGAFPIALGAVVWDTAALSSDAPPATERDKGDAQGVLTSRPPPFEGGRVWNPFPRLWVPPTSGPRPSQGGCDL